MRRFRPNLLRRGIAVLLCLVMLCNGKKAQAESLHAAAIEVVVGIVAVTAAITVTVVLVIKHSPSLKGCAAAGPDGFQLTDSEGQTFTLIGDVAGIKPGERVRVSGKKENVAAGAHRFVVEKAKDYGPCPATAPH